MYVNIWVRRFQGGSDDPELAVPWAIPLATSACIVCGISLVVAFWGVWQWATPLIVVVHLIALIMSSTFIPSIGSTGKKTDHASAKMENTN